MKEDDNKKAHEPFFIVPSRVFDKGLSPYELSVLFYLMMRADNEKHTCFPSVKSMAKICKISERKVREVIHSLETKGIIEIKANYVPTRNDFNRQTSNHYLVNIFCTPCAHKTPTLCTKNTPSMNVVHTPPVPPAEEINKTKPNITKSNITKSTELTVDEAVEMEKERFSFLELKRECFEILKNERGLEEEYILLLDRAVEHLYFKNGAEYEGQKYTQNDVRVMLKEKITPDVLASSVEFLNASKEPVRSPVPYLATCILGGLVNGFYAHKKSEKAKENLDGMNGRSSFDVDEFFAAALRHSMGEDFKF